MRQNGYGDMRAIKNTSKQHIDAVHDDYNGNNDKDDNDDTIDIAMLAMVLLLSLKLAC